MFNLGDKVYDRLYGEGVISKIHSYGILMDVMTIQDGEDRYQTYFRDGRIADYQYDYEEGEKPNRYLGYIAKYITLKKE